MEAGFGRTNARGNGQKSSSKDAAFPSTLSKVGLCRSESVVRLDGTRAPPRAAFLTSLFSWGQAVSTAWKAVRKRRDEQRNGTVCYLGLQGRAFSAGRERMESQPQRRSDRVSLTLLLEASGTDRLGHSFKEPTRTLLINRGGAMIVLGRELNTDQRIHVKRQTPTEAHRESDVRIVGQYGREKEGYLYGIEIVNGSDDLWGIEFPPLAQSEEAVARMLMECSYCRSREVAYLNEMELRGFEINRGIARHCKNCGVPSIWTQAPHEDEKKLASRAARKRGHDGQEQVPEEGEKRERQRLRLKTRLTACIRQAGTDDELAVCEDISPRS